MSKKETPLMRQYTQIKQKYPETILLYRLGDFFETFEDDAKITAKVCGITLTKRNNGAGADMPLAGFPHHQIDNYLPKLVRAGYRVAVCEQLEDPKHSRGIVKRDVVEVVTPGVALYDKLLESNRNNYIASIYQSENRKYPNIVGVSVVDVSTGEFITSEMQINSLTEYFESIQPSEILISKAQKTFFEPIIERLPFNPVTTKYEPWFFDESFAKELLIKHFELKNLKGFGISDATPCVIACGAVFNYIKDTQKSNLDHLKSIRFYNVSEMMFLDNATRRNLEIAFSLLGASDGGLLKVLDKTKTAFGARLLRRWLNNPLKDLSRINLRLDAVSTLFDDKTMRNNLSKCLEQVDDLERLNAKISSGRANPRDCISLLNSLKQIPIISELIINSPSRLLKKLSDKLDPLKDICDLIENSLIDEPSVQLGQGTCFRAGYNAELDSFVEAKFSGKQWLADFQEKERDKTGISSLKVGFNNVFGYYIEITNAHKNKIPDYFDRRQTLTNAERYTTPQLKEYENKILAAESQILEIEQKLFAQLRQSICFKTLEIQTNAEMVATLDCLLSFAQISKDNNYIRPVITDSEKLEIIDGRHPVVEKLLPKGDKFTPNSTLLNTSDNLLHIITGPNMSGKSCYLRQVGLIVFLGQIGCFVPANSAHFGLVDRIFTRVGAQDNITGGESTFLVEMQEAASIINSATRKSLILLDEVGRGTATFDGISIAWALAEYVHNELKAKTLFATHYHELNDLAERYEGIKNYKVEIIETNNNIVFTHKVSVGKSDHSFGIHVAKMAGLPKLIIDRANEIMANFEGSIDANEDAKSNKKKPDISRITTRKDHSIGHQLSIFEFTDDKLRKKIRDIKIENITPIEAFNVLVELLEEVR